MASETRGTFFFGCAAALVGLVMLGLGHLGDRFPCLILDGGVRSGSTPSAAQQTWSRVDAADG